MIHLEELNLSSNYFSSQTSLYNPNKLFIAMASIPRLKRLNLSYNKLSGIHYEEMQIKKINFDRLIDLDFSYNNI